MKARSSTNARAGKVVTLQQAAALIGNPVAVAIQGSGGGIAEPTALLRAIRERFDSDGQPSDLTLMHATGLGDLNGIGTDLLAVPGLVKRDIAGHLGMAPRMNDLIRRNEVESFNFPQGVISQMFGAVAARKPGVFTKVGLDTYIDPRLEGGRMNEAAARASDAPSLRIERINGEDWLFFPRWRVDVALIRGTTADLRGNITCEQEAAILEGIKIAQAAKACGGIVIAQVKRLAENGSLDPRAVRVPSTCVDYVVVDPDQKQTTISEFDPALCGEVRAPLARIEPLPLSVRKVVARRAADALFAGAVVNLGYGMPDGVASVAAERGMIDDITLTVEQGLIGGVPSPGVIFGSSMNPEAIIAEDDQFAFYDGGNLDIAYLGMAQCDRHGNVNVSKVGPMLAGCGGFINITQNAKAVVFCGTFTAKGFQAEVGDGRLSITSEGAARKFVSDVEQITFSGKRAGANGQRVWYVTERAVFKLDKGQLVLREIAPGVDLRRDVVAQMDFQPRIDPNLKPMKESLFREYEPSSHATAGESTDFPLTPEAMCQPA